MMMSHSCVDVTAWPLASDTCNELVVGHLLRTGVPSITNICIALVSAMASLVLSVTVAVKARRCVELGDVVVTFDATTALLL